MSILLSYQSLIILAAAAAGFVFLFRRVLSLDRAIKRLLGGTDGSDTEKDLQMDMLRRIARMEAKLEEIDPRLDLLDAISRASIQKVGFVRFNPFSDTGGDNSFILALLDRQNSGVLISSLYLREAVRVYAKAVERGKSKHILSEEEQKLLNDTIQRQI